MNGRRRPADGRRRIAAVALIVATAGGGSGCGDDEPPRARAAGTSNPGLPTAEDRSGPDDGRLTTASGTKITDFGNPRDRQRAVRAFVALQRDFRAGRMAAACDRINDFLLGQFVPPGTRPDSSCRAKLRAYADELARRGVAAPRSRLLWVRSYTSQAGIWIDDERGQRRRIPLSASPPGSAWLLDLGAMPRRALIAGTLAGAKRYLRR